MEQEKSSSRVNSLPDLAASLFSLILSLRTSAAYGREDELRSRINEYLGRIDREGRDAGIAREDIEAAKFPLVAFIDETILNSNWEGRERWREHPLQLDLYRETVAGERFFERLEKIRAKGEAKADLLQIYWLCLVLGFEGKYKLLGLSTSCAANWASPPPRCPSRRSRRTAAAGTRAGPRARARSPRSRSWPVASAA
jgi:type VI secretion system protein ImpK